MSNCSGSGSSKGGGGGGTSTKNAGANGGANSIDKQFENRNITFTGNSLIDAETTEKFKIVLATVANQVDMKNTSIELAPLKIGVGAQFDPITKKIQVNTFQLKKLLNADDEAYPKLDSARPNGFALPENIHYGGEGGVIRAFITHEYGHKLDIESGYKYSKKLFSPKEEVKYKNLNKSSSVGFKLANTISYYASQNKLETVAEAYSLKNSPKFSSLPQATKDSVNFIWND